ncbi:addiction module protein [Azohydromonas aeria]|uniref:addiction module protein n=1 Tax=Azohydromonas aeria TaxID=2590212 RepID=UPI0012F7864F|nr:addiction module protein [Azohydromonas aeria]
MTVPVQELQAQVLGLPAEERARLLEVLLASFEPQGEAPESQETWLRLAQQRREEVRAGKVAMVPGDEALARIRARLG